MFEWAVTAQCVQSVINMQDGATVVHPGFLGECGRENLSTHERVLRNRHLYLCPDQRMLRMVKRQLGILVSLWVLADPRSYREVRSDKTGLSTY